MQSFLDNEAASGVLLLAATVVALAWSNSPWQQSYYDFWGTSVVVGVGRWQISRDLQHWVNEGLMALFFLVVGLEIKREFVSGELPAPPPAPPLCQWWGPSAGWSCRHCSTWPSIWGAESRSGWGIPMATDIAFALGVLTPLAAPRAPAALKPFLLTMAIVDDLGAILVIAVFYSANVTLLALLVTALLCGLIALLQAIMFGPRSRTWPSASACGWPCSSPGSTPPSPAWSWPSSRPPPRSSGPGR